MNCLLLSNNGIALNLPPSLGGSVANYNYMLKLDMIYRQVVVLPSNINNKEVVMLGEVWTTGSMSNKTSANTLHITWNKFNSSVELHALSTYYAANVKIKVEKKFNFGNINNLQIMLSSYQSGSANASAGWNLNDGNRLNPRANLTLYWN
ncbi:TPA: hypothetical protein R5311_000252 [Campylobacter jejuni]|uniref:Uncharacterized protein n=1 Tax=Campylobacter jejuni TaxID=197 RepID=A0A5Z1S936_CAMJU|nr:hypothetical protein [Campylobacter jejuni]ECL2485474.1 hypothetical protein [Campylobacter coli]EAK7599863.1 hypothetical protein [Campylobacter jejuni]EAK7610486.1 hypothetical protein [Campylobacter jejuni]EAK7653706.1 hypothetical protein [Campylobacter jejuni]EAK7726906.1 hypothetical protein [Campylobacter jejuni]